MSRFSSARDIQTLPAAALFFLTAPGPVALMVFIGGLAAFKTLLWGWGRADLLQLVVIVSGWEFVEWGVHRYLMHGEALPLVGMKIPNPLQAAHLEHHRHPDVISNVLFGPVNAILAVIVVGGLAALVLRDTGSFFSISMLLSLMLIRYDWFHLLAHSSVVPDSAWLWRIVSGHRKHHAVSGAGHYGVSGLLLGGLMREKRDS